MREHRDEVVLDLIEFDDGGAPSLKLTVEFHVTCGNGKVLAQQPDGKNVEPGMRIAARRSSSSSSAPSLRLADSTNASPPDTARSGTSRSLVSAKPPFGRATSNRDSAPIRSRTPPSNASTSACGSSAAKIPRAIDVNAVSRSFCIANSAPRSTDSVMSCSIST
jgi:hypothetical protein